MRVDIGQRGKGLLMNDIIETSCRKKGEGVADAEQSRKVWGATEFTAQ